jgi:hypothetical protein
VLSACETARGEPAAGEGVLGMQRALHVAGAQSVVASLWETPSLETQRLMARFYDNMWRRKLGPLAALRQAQLALLRPNVAGSGVAPADVRTPPYLWAAWVLSGEPGDLSAALADAPAPETFAGAGEASPSLAPVLWTAGAAAGVAATYAAWRRRPGRRLSALGGRPPAD